MTHLAYKFRSRDTQVVDDMLISYGLAVQDGPDVKNLPGVYRMHMMQADGVGGWWYLTDVSLFSRGMAIIYGGFGNGKEYERLDTAFVVDGTEGTEPMGSESYRTMTGVEKIDIETIQNPLHYFQ